MDQFFVTPPDWQTALFTAGAVLALAVLVASAGARLVRFLIFKGFGEHTHLTSRSPAVRTPLRLVRLVLFLAVTIALTPPAFQLAGAPLRRGLRLEQVTHWAATGGVRLLMIALAAFVLVRATRLMVRRFEQQISEGTQLEVLERAKRARTLGGLIQNLVIALVCIIAGLMMLREVGLDITPILTGAGILGLAVGFGAQTLVKDIISGFFIILENQIRVGDVVEVEGRGGFVEEVNLRTLLMRDLEGSLHVIPNGSITAVKNMTRDFSFYVIDLPVGFSTDTDAVADLAREVARGLREDPAYAPFILDDLEVLGVDAFRDWSVTLKVRIKTVPLKQWMVGREMRRRLKIAYEKAGIEFPIPSQRTNVAPALDFAKVSARPE